MPKPKSDKPDPKQTWDALTAHVARLEKGNELLEKLYLEIGPYQNGKVDDKTWDEVRNFFGFDDSE